ncbi:hypothetical protein Tco_0577173, partial [Tanacetum coccineum]
MADMKFYVEHNKVVAFLEKTKRKSDGFHDIIDFIKSTPIRLSHRIQLLFAGLEERRRLPERRPPPAP